MLREYTAAITGAGIELTHVLNPFESDINLFPETVEGLRASLASRLRLPSPRLIPPGLIRWRGSRDMTPGRLYTFVGNKTDG
jgi:hypothetical protein